MSALTLVAVVGAVEPASIGTRVLLLPPSVQAPDEVRLLADAVGKRLRESQRLVLVPEQRFRELLSGAGRPAPSAAPLRTEVDASLRQVKDYYRKLALGDAIRVLQELENSRLSQLACPENVSFAASISFWLGVVHAATDQPEKARERFGSALFIDPEMAIDKVYFPPPIVAMFEEVREGLQARATGGMSIATDPDGTQLFVDGRPAGTAPLTLNLPGGDHFVCARRLGSRDWVARLHVSAGRVESQQIFLQRSQANELADQLVALLAGAGSIDFQSPSHIEAVGGTVGAEVVASVVGPGALGFRWVGRPNVGEKLVAAGSEASTAAVAEGLVAQLEQRVSSAPAASGPSSRSTPRQLEILGGGGYCLSMGLGPQAGLAIGVQLPLAGPASLATQFSANRSMTTLSLLGLPPPGSAFGGSLLLRGSAELDAWVEVRWDLLSSAEWRAYVAVGVAGQSTAFGDAAVERQPANATVTVPAGRGISMLMLGPRAGLGASRSLSERWEVLLAGAYSVGFVLGHPDLQATMTGAGGLSGGAVFVPHTFTRQQLSVRLGLGMGF